MLAIKVTLRERSLRGLYMYVRNALLVGLGIATASCSTHSILDLTEGGGQGEITSWSTIRVSMTLRFESVNVKIQIALVTDQSPVTSFRPSHRRETEPFELN